MQQMTRKALEWIRKGRALVAAEAERVGFDARTTVIIACAIVAIALPWYHEDKNWFSSLLSWIGGPSLVSLAKRYAIDYTFVIRVGLPLLAIFALREKFRDFGLGLGNIKTGLKICLVFYLLYIPCFIVLFLDSGFREYYSGVTHYATWGQFCQTEILVVVFLSIREEFLYRGFILFGIQKKYGAYVGILAQVFPYVLMHLGKPEMEALGSLPVGLALGYCAARTGSIWYGAVMHGSIALMFNAAILLLHFMGH